MVSALRLILAGPVASYYLDFSGGAKLLAWPIGGIGGIYGFDYSTYHNARWGFPEGFQIVILGIVLGWDSARILARIDTLITFEVLRRTMLRTRAPGSD